MDIKKRLHQHRKDLKRRREIEKSMLTCPEEDMAISYGGSGSSSGKSDRTQRIALKAISEREKCGYYDIVRSIARMRSALQELDGQEMYVISNRYMHNIADKEIYERWEYGKTKYFQVKKSALEKLKQNFKEG